jgi:nucleoside-diphosphate-sugar epimerase
MRVVFPIRRNRLAALGWKPKTSLVNGIRETYDWFSANRETAWLKAGSS